MKALWISDYGAPLHLDEIPVPTPGPGQVLVENAFTSRNNVDPGRAQGFLRHVFDLPFPWTPGGDTAGRVAAVGEGVIHFKVGDEVFGYARLGGAYAEFLVIDATSLGHRPASLPADMGAAVALVGQTATQMLKQSKIQAGQTALILGASGGVGPLAIQLAKLAGIKIIAAARGNKLDVLKDLGADEVVDLATERLEDIPQVDVVFNLIGGDTTAPSYARVKKGGMAITLNRPPDADEAKRLGIEAIFVETQVTTEGLEAFAALVDAGKVKPYIAKTETLWAPETLWDKPATEEIGKIVFSVKS